MAIRERRYRVGTASAPIVTRAYPKKLGDSGGPIAKDQNGPEIYATIFTSRHPVEKGRDRTGSDDGKAFLTRRRRLRLEGNHPARGCPKKIREHQV